MLQTVCIRITGKVQGVYFRQSAKEKAKSLQLTGSVKNLQDGSVEIIATGESEKIQELCAWCKQGPPRARVSEIIITPLPLQSFTGFIILR